MPHALEGHAERVAELIRAQNKILDRFLQWRCTEEPDLDLGKLQRGCHAYIRWCALACEAAVANLSKRGWSATKDMLIQIATDSLRDAVTNPSEGETGVPTLLISAFLQNTVLARWNAKESQLIAADLDLAMPTGRVLLGEENAQNLQSAAQAIAIIDAMVLITDQTTAGAESLKVAPETLPTLQQLISGSRNLSAEETALTGRWIHEEFYTSGGFSANSELHLFLLEDGHCLFTSRTGASLQLGDALGNPDGFLEMASGLDPGDRGSWRFEPALLTLTMDDGSLYEFKVLRADRSSILTRNTTSGNEWLWTRTG